LIAETHDAMEEAELPKRPLGRFAVSIFRAGGSGKQGWSPAEDEVFMELVEQEEEALGITLPCNVRDLHPAFERVADKLFKRVKNEPDWKRNRSKEYVRRTGVALMQRLRDIIKARKGEDEQEEEEMKE